MKVCGLCYVELIAGTDHRLQLGAIIGKMNRRLRVHLAKTRLTISDNTTRMTSNVGTSLMNVPVDTRTVTTYIRQLAETRIDTLGPPQLPLRVCRTKNHVHAMILGE